MVPILRASLLTMLVSASSLPAQTFVFHLRGDQEVPPTTSLATGGCMATLNQPASQLTITCVHNVAGATVMHIHRGVAGTTGPVVFDLGSPVSPVNATWSGMTPADISDLLAGNLYVNIHTAGRPAGEIRGQILPRTVDTVSFTANGAQVVPPNSTSATASCTADLDDTATSLAVNCTHNLPSPQEAHVHEAPFGEIGPAVFTFPSASSPMSANVPMTPQLVADFAATFLYLDIHGPTGSDESIPADEIRGQIGMPPAAATTGTIRIVKATTPAGGSGFGFTDNVPGSGGSFTLNDGGTRTFSNVAPGTYTITENNPAGYSLTDVVCTDTDSSGNPVTRTATVHLQAAETVTCTFRNLQSVTPSSLFVFNLSGEQEVPAVTTTSRGGCFGQFDSTAKQLSIVCTHDVVSPTMMHVHRGAAGATGPVVFDLGNPTSPVQAVWNMAPSDVADLLAGNLYVNVHASGRPNGEIRGQIVPRSVDSFDFPMSGSQDVPPTDSTAIGACHADLADDATSVAVSCRHNIANPIGSHLHDGFPGVDGPIVFDFPNNNPFSGNAPLTPRLVADFAAGFLYTNVHSPNYTDGEIRGQLIAGAVVNPAGIPTLHGWLAMLLGAAFVSLALWRLR